MPEKKNATQWWSFCKKKERDPSLQGKSKIRITCPVSGASVVPKFPLKEKSLAVIHIQRSFSNLQSSNLAAQSISSPIMLLEGDGPQPVYGRIKCSTKSLKCELLLTPQNATRRTPWKLICFAGYLENTCSVPCEERMGDVFVRKLQ